MENQKEAHNFRHTVIVLVVIIALAYFLFLFKAPITGMITYTPTYHNWTFGSSTGYTYDSSLIEILNNQARLKQIEYGFVNNLLAEYRFDEETWINITVEDSVGDNDGTAYNGVDTVAEGKINRAGSFDGSDGYVDLGTFDIIGDGLTIVAWFKADDFDTSDARIISKATSQSEQDHYWMLSTIKQGSNYRLRFRLKTDGNTKTLIASSGNLNVGEWVHAAAVYDGSNMVLYKDGVEVGSTSKSGTISTNDAVSVWVGDNPGQHRKRFDGVIDEIVIYNIGLSSSDITEIYNTQSQGNREYVYYAGNGSLETENLVLPSVNQLNLFSKNEDLNGQEINYYYSNDTGDSWNSIPQDGGLGSLDQIKVKVDFNSDSSNTPVLYNMILTYDYCKEDWTCSGWSECYDNNTQTRACNDLNECGTEESKPEEVKNCTYFPGYYEMVNSGTIFLKGNETTVVNASDLVLDLVPSEDISGEINIEKNLDNLSGLGGKKMVSNVNISVGSDVNDKLTSAVIKIYYDDEDINNLNEDGLKIYYYINGSWLALTTTINKEGNYVYTTIKHFSIYGLFGEEKSSSGTSSPTSGGSTSEAGWRGELKSKTNATGSEVVEEVVSEQEVKKGEVKSVPLTESEPEFIPAGKVVYSKGDVVEYTKRNIYFVIIVIVLVGGYLVLRYCFLNKHRREFHKQSKE